MKSYYELHITMKPQSQKKFEQIKKDTQAICKSLGWIFSAIDNDIVLGSGVKLYATLHLSDERYDLLDCIQILKAAFVSLKGYGCNPVRMKIEHVVYDKLKGRDFE